MDNLTDLGWLGFAIWAWLFTSAVAVAAIGGLAYILDQRDRRRSWF